MVLGSLGVDPPHHAALRLVVDDLGLDRILKGEEPVPTSHRPPHVVGDVPLADAAGPAPGAVVLEAPAHRVGNLHAVAHLVELPQGHDVGEGPVPSLVEGDADATVVPGDHSLGIHWIDPHGVMIHVDADGGGSHIGAAVIRDIHGGGGPVDPIGIGGVHPHLGVVEGPGVVGVPSLPSDPSINGTVETRRGGLILRSLGLNEGVHDARVALGDGQADATQHPGGEAFGL